MTQERRSRNWIFTVNNPVTSQILQSYTQIKFLSAELEYVSCLHYQGYLELTTARTMTSVKSIFSSLNPMPHLEQRRATRARAIGYTLKDCLEELGSSTRSVEPSTSLTCVGNLRTTGSTQSALPALILYGFSGPLSELVTLTLTKQTVKERLAAIQNQIQNGVDEKSIADNDFDLWIKYGRQFNRYALLCSNPRSHKTKISVVQGPTGSGKSYYCRERFPTAFWKPRSQWWDGYVNQSAVIIDEYYGWLPYDLLLRLGDQYPLSVEVKGGSVNFNSDIILITTNKHPSNWYANVYFDAFIRRVEEWIVIKQRDDIVVCDNYENTQFINI